MEEKQPEFLEYLGVFSLVLLRVVDTTDPWGYTAVIEKDYSLDREFASPTPGRPRVLDFNPHPMGLMNQGDRALVFLYWNEERRGFEGLHEEPVRGHLRVEALEGAEHVIFPSPRLWLSDDVPLELRGHFREDPTRPEASAIPFLVLDPYLRAVLARLPPRKKVYGVLDELMDHALKFKKAPAPLIPLAQWKAPAPRIPLAQLVQSPPVGQDVARKTRALGLMARRHFQRGHAEKALPLLQQTTTHYRQARDMKNLAAEMAVLFEVYRYLGQGAEAAEAAQELGWAMDHSGSRAQADRIWDLAKAFPRGEPLNRVVVDFKGATYELDALPAHGVRGGLRFSFCRNREELARCTAQVQRGRELAQQGRFEEALACFTEACRLDSYSPAPRYEGAEVLLQLQRASEAVAGYDETEALAPGWYACRARRWLAAGIASGKIPHAAFLLLRKLERAELSAEESMALVERALRETPAVAEFHWHLGRRLVALGREGEAVGAFAEGLARAEEPDVRSRLLVELAALLPDSPERKERLREAMKPGGHLIAAAMAEVMLHKGPSQRPDPRRADSTRVVHQQHPSPEVLQLLANCSLESQPVPPEHLEAQRHLDVCEACAEAYSMRIPPQWTR